MTKIIFIDESGNSNLVKPDANYPLFILCAVVFDKTYYEQVAVGKINDFKVKYFGSTEIILHSSEFLHPLRQEHTKFIYQKPKRLEFYKELSALLESLEFHIIYHYIDKAKLLPTKLDPYEILLPELIDSYLAAYPNDIAEMALEQRGDNFDKYTELAWVKTRSLGTKIHKAKHIKKHIKKLSLQSKYNNICGIQIADLVATPIGRNMLKKQEYLSFEMIKKKVLIEKGLTPQLQY